MFQTTFILRRPRVANFADIIKLPTMFIKEKDKDSKKVKYLEICIKMQPIYIFLNITEIADFQSRNTDAS